MQSRWLGRLLATLALLAVMAGALWHFLSPGTRHPVEAPPQISKSDFKYHHSPPVISSSAKETDPERDLAGQPKSLRSSGLRLPGNIPVTGESGPGAFRVGYSCAIRLQPPGAGPPSAVGAGCPPQRSQTDHRCSQRMTNWPNRMRHTTVSRLAISLPPVAK